MNTLNEEVPKFAALQAAKEITSGSVAGMASKVFEHPFDLTKVRLQSQVLADTPRFSGPVDCLKQTWQKEGLRGLYRGLPAPIAGAMGENATLFLAYTELQNAIRRSTHRPTNEKLPLHLLALAGSGAGAITSFLLTPIELVKCKMQVQMLVTTSPSINLPGPISVLISVIRTQGLTGLWLGHTGTFVRETGGTAAWFWTKEFVASLLLARRLGKEAATSTTKRIHELRPWESALSGACAGVAFNLSLFPADTVKSAMQTEGDLRPRNPHASTALEKPSFFRTFVAMYRAKGIRGLYAGCGITVARSIPSSAIVFLIYDELKKHLS